MIGGITSTYCVHCKRIVLCFSCSIPQCQFHTRPTYDYCCGFYALGHRSHGLYPASNYDKLCWCSICIPTCFICTNRHYMIVNILEHWGRPYLCGYTVYRAFDKLYITCTPATCDFPNCHETSSGVWEIANGCVFVNVTYHEFHNPSMFSVLSEKWRF